MCFGDTSDEIQFCMNDQGTFIRLKREDNALFLCFSKLSTGQRIRRFLDCLNKIYSHQFFYIFFDMGCTLNWWVVWPLRILYKGLTPEISVGSKLLLFCGAHLGIIKHHAKQCAQDSFSLRLCVCVSVCVCVMFFRLQWTPSVCNVCNKDLYL